MWRVVHQFTHWCTLPSASAIADPFGGGFIVWQVPLAQNKKYIQMKSGQDVFSRFLPRKHLDDDPKEDPDEADSRRANGQAPRSGRQVQQERRWADTSPHASVPVHAPGASRTTAWVPSVTPSRTAQAICAGTGAGAISYGGGGGDDT
ncbi:hypothetical protein GGX14DRAFT_400972 [Mycena pura]|uniref:Uncharacterized protein n=1 Tax=Mycena pura TaxID=153505 RepID=A0AAD6V3S1_9AGAR|nr:hypothetical protein GGX14DRAFT_400972 [Mycena pura]